MFLYYDGNKYIKISLAFVPLFFHVSSIFIILFYFTTQIFFISNTKEKIIYFIASIVVVLSFFLFYSDIFFGYVKYYVLQDTYKSVGAPFRAFLISIFALIYLLKSSRKNTNPFYNFVKISSIFVLLVFPASFFFTTPVDRILAYFLILKLIISQEIIKVFANKYKNLITLLLITMSFSYMVIWLYFGKNSYMWLNFETLFI